MANSQSTINPCAEIPLTERRRDVPFEVISYDVDRLLKCDEVGFYLGNRDVRIEGEIEPGTPIVDRWVDGGRFGVLLGTVDNLIVVAWSPWVQP